MTSWPFEKHHFLEKPALSTFLTASCKIFATLYSNIWSHRHTGWSKFYVEKRLPVCE